MRQNKLRKLLCALISIVLYLVCGTFAITAEEAQPREALVVSEVTAAEDRIEVTVGIAYDKLSEIRGIQIDIEGIDHQILQVVSCESLISDTQAASNTASYFEEKQKIRLVYVKLSGTLEVPEGGESGMAFLKILFRVNDSIQTDGSLELPITVKIQAAEQITENDTLSIPYSKLHTHTPGPEADCVNDQVCTECGEVLKEKLGHDYKAVVTAPTCTEQGYTTHTCTRCDDSYIDTEVAPLGHKPGAEATCTTAQTCNVCGEELVAALGHKPGAAADCIKDQTCTVCGVVLTEKLGHDYKATVTAPTCTENGYTTHTCTRCDDTYTDAEVAPLGHKPGAAADCVKDQTCTVCGVVLTEKLGHDYKATVTAPTCTEKGYTTHTCTRCDDTYTDTEVAPLGHKPGDEATCTTAQTCKVCGEEMTAAQGHIPGEWIIDQEPAAGVEGSMHKECTICQAVVDEAIIEALPVETEAETETETEPEAEPETESETELNTELGTELATEPVTEPEAEPETKSETVAESETKGKDPGSTVTDGALETTPPASTEKAPATSGCFGSINGTFLLLLLMLAVLPMMAKRSKES